MKKSVLLLTSLLAMCVACSDSDEETINNGETNVKKTLTACPDGHHPHVVDLGLSSGTKWACSNVDATSPEDFGKYFAWGETNEIEYNMPTFYTHVDDEGNYLNIGSDIAGTSYDVAKAHMGETWKMPTHEQQIELIQQCSRQWITHNGVKGTLVTGPNGNQIFLPATGRRLGQNIEGVGDFGNYWSSTYDKKSESSACSMYASSTYWFWSYYDSERYIGLTVRAVAQENKTAEQ